MRTKLLYLAFFLVVVLLNFNVSPATGLVLTSASTASTNTGSRAIIWHQSNNQSLILSPAILVIENISAYLVAVPTKPEISEVQSEIFSNFQKLNSRTNSYTESSVPNLIVTNTLVNQPQDRTALKTWLMTQGYNPPENLEISPGWYYILIELDIPKIFGTKVNYPFQNTKPILITFSSPNSILYPPIYQLTKLKPVEPIVSPLQSDLSSIIGAWSWENGTEIWKSLGEKTQELKTNQAFNGSYVEEMARGRNVVYGYSEGTIYKVIDGLEVGQNYLFSGYIKPTESTSGMAGLAVGNPVEKSRLENLANISGWKKVEVSFTATHTSYWLRLYTVDLHGEVWWDAVQLTKGSVAPIFTKEVTEKPQLPLPTSTPTSSLPRASYPPLTVYVLSDHKKTSSNMALTYSGYILPKAITELAITDSGSPLIPATSEMNLTQLTENSAPVYYSSVRYFLDAADDDPTEFGVIKGSAEKKRLQLFKMILLFTIPLPLELLAVFYFLHRKSSPTPV